MHDRMRGGSSGSKSKSNERRGSIPIQHSIFGAGPKYALYSWQREAELCDFRSRAAPAASGSETQLSLSSRIEHPEQNGPGAPVALHERASQGGIRGAVVLAVALAPALTAVWMVPWFVTQDGPAHVYNAQILAWSFDPQSPFQSIYTIQWEPIPNWVGTAGAGGAGDGIPRLGGGSAHDHPHSGGLRVGSALAAMACGWGQGSGRRGPAGSPAGDERRMALSGSQASCFGACLFPRHTGRLVVRPRPTIRPAHRRHFLSAGRRVFLPPGQRGADRLGPGDLGDRQLLHTRFG